MTKNIGGDNDREYAEIIVSQVESKEEEPQPEEMPQTPIWLLVALLAVSAGVLTTVSIRGRKRITRNFSESVD